MWHNKKCLIGNLRKDRPERRRSYGLKNPVRFESLESRTLLSLLGFSPDFPRLDYNAAGAMTFDAGTGAIHVSASPVSFALDNTVEYAPVFDFGAFIIDFSVNTSGAITGGVPGHDLHVTGQLDFDEDGFPDYIGDLLTGEILDFGFLNSGGSVTDQFDFRFQLTGGALAPFYAAQDLGVTLTGENFQGIPGFVNFSTNFTVVAKGVLGGVAPKVQPASLGDYVWNDADHDGTQDNDEAGVEFALVELLDADGNLLDSQITGADGAYLFTGLTPATYFVRFTPPTGYSMTTQNAGSDDSLDSDADITTGLTALISLASGEVNLTIDAGVFPTIDPATASIDVEKYVRVADESGGGTEGFTPGYWKQPQHLADWTNFNPLQSYNAVFGVNDPSGPAMTLLQALQRGGSGSAALGRHAVAALLNAAHENVDFAFAESQVIALVQQAFASGNFEAIKNQLAAENEKEGDITSGGGGGGASAFNPTNLGDDADAAPGPTFTSLDSLVFTYSLTNNGELDLTAVTLIDDNQTPGTGDDFAPTPVLVAGFNYGDADSDGVLDIGETWYYTAVGNAGSAGQHVNVATATGTPADNSDDVMDSDAAYWFITGAPTPLGSLSGFVYVDTDNDGEIDLSDSAIQGASVQLTGINDLNQPVSLSTTTNANGQYFFENLRPGTYSIHENQPAGYLDGLDSLGTLGGTPSNDNFADVDLLTGQDGMNYNFGERIDPASATVHAGQTATIGYWQNKNGQALIKSLNGSQNATGLSSWLASNFPNLYGASAGASNLTGKTNTQVASFFVTLFKQKGVKLDAQVLAVAFATYVTDSDLAGAVAASYGFVVNTSGTGAATFNVGAAGAAFGVANNTTLTVMQFLQAANALSLNGVLYGGNTTLRNLANTIFTAINESGDIV